MATINGAVFVAGQYLVTYNSVACGIMRGDAGMPTLEQTTFAQTINNTDAYGDTPVDTVYRGFSWTAEFVCEEYKPGSLAAFYPWGALGVLGAIGRLGSASGAPLVLTVLAGTPAVGNPNTITATNSILPPNFPAKLLFGPMLREVPIRQQLMPYVTGGSITAFTQTAILFAAFLGGMASSVLSLLTSLA